LEVVEVPSRFEISDELWAEVQPLIPVRQRRRRKLGRKAIDDRLVLNGILHVLHTGIAWEDLPREYGYGVISTNVSVALLARLTSGICKAASHVRIAPAYIRHVTPPMPSTPPHGMAIADHLAQHALRDERDK
jgi:transposase